MEDKHSHLLENTARLLEYHASICSCGAPAYPIEQKGNKYKCIRCYKQLCNVSYNLGNRYQNGSWVVSQKDPSQILEMTHYDDAINLLKSRYKKNKKPFFLRFYSIFKFVNR